MKKIIIASLFLIVACRTQPQSNISEETVKTTIEGFFKALDMDNQDPNLMSQYVTQDFIIYEAGQKMSKKQFQDFVNWPPNMKQTTWELSGYRISIEGNSAHASLFNNGTFTSETDSLKIDRKLEWLESAYLVKENDSLKIKFYFSDRVKASRDTTQLK